jgi:hypothetical protein
MKVRLALATTVTLVALGGTASIAGADAGPAADGRPTFTCAPFDGAGLPAIVTPGRQLGAYKAEDSSCTRNP